MSAAGLAPVVFWSQVRDAAERGDPGARKMLEALRGRGRAPAGKRAAPAGARAARAVRRDEFCAKCGAELDGAGTWQCACAKPVSPGPAPFAEEAVAFHPAGLAVARMLARRAFTPLELSTARASVSAHAGAGVAGLNGALDGASAFFVCRSLDALRAAGAKAIVLHITSGGGSVPAGLAIVRAIERLRAEGVPTIACITHHANSMASVVAVAADLALMAPTATMMVHEASGGRDDHLAILKNRLLELYEARTLVDAATLEGYLAGAVTMDAYTAHSYGFVDEVADAARVEEVARAAASSGLWSSTIRAANSWRQRVLRERAADAEGCVRLA